MSIKTEKYHPVRDNTANIAKSMHDAAAYIRDKFPHSEKAQEFYKNFKYIESQDGLSSYVFQHSGSFTSKDLPEFLHERHLAGGFSFLKDFFINEMRNGTRDGTYTDPKLAAKIYQSLAVWGCFEGDISSRVRFPVQDAIDGYMSLKVTVKKDPIPLPKTYKATREFTFTGDLDNPHRYIDRYVDAIVAMVMAHDDRDDLSCLFYNYDYKTETGYIEIRSTKDFEALLAFTCDKSKYLKEKKNGFTQTQTQAPKPLAFKTTRSPLKRR